MATVHQLLGAVLSWDRTCEPTDAQLLVDYNRHQDAAALETLVHRHGSMVWRVCRRVLQRLVELGLLARTERRVGGVRAGSGSHTYLLTAAGRRVTLSALSGDLRRGVAGRSL